MIKLKPPHDRILHSRRFFDVKNSGRNTHCGAGAGGKSQKSKSQQHFLFWEFCFFFGTYVRRGRTYQAFCFVQMLLRSIAFWGACVAIGHTFFMLRLSSRLQTNHENFLVSSCNREILLRREKIFPRCILRQNPPHLVVISMLTQSPAVKHRLGLFSSILSKLLRAFLEIFCLLCFESLVFLRKC